MGRSCSLSVCGHLAFWNMFCNAFVPDQLTRARTSIYRNVILSSISGMWMLSSGWRRTDWTLYFLCFPRELERGHRNTILVSWYHVIQLLPQVSTSLGSIYFKVIWDLEKQKSEILFPPKTHQRFVLTDLLLSSRTVVPIFNPAQMKSRRAVCVLTMLHLNLALF